MEITTGAFELAASAGVDSRGGKSSTIEFADWTFAPSDVSRPSILFIESKQAAEKYARSLKVYVDLREAHLYQFKKSPKQQ